MSRRPVTSTASYKMYSSSQSLSANQSVNVIGLVVSAAWVAVAATLNIVPVATAYWLNMIVNTREVFGESANVQVNFGLWSVCGHESLSGQSRCVDISNPSDLGLSLYLGDYTVYVQAARALSIAAAAMCLISVPLAMAAYAIKNAAPVFVAALVAFIQSATLATALLVFFLKLWIDITSLLKDAGLDSYIADKFVNIQVTPGWSFYLGGGGVIVYFLGSLFFGVTGILIAQGNRRSAVSVNVIEERPGMTYRPLTEIAPPKTLQV